MQKKPEFFLSYSHSDEEKVRPIQERLLQAGIPSVWVDYEQIRPGSVVLREISEGIERCSHVLAFLSPKAATSDWVWLEMSAAAAKGPDVLIPILLPGLQDSQIPAIVKGMQYVDLRREPADAPSALLQFLTGSKPDNAVFVPTEIIAPEPRLPTCHSDFSQGLLVVTSTCLPTVPLFHEGGAPFGHIQQEIDESIYSKIGRPKQERKHTMRTGRRTIGDGMTQWQRWQSGQGPYPYEV